MFLKRRQVLSLSVDKDKCIGCESCVVLCRRKVLDMRYDFDSYYAWAKYPEDCVGCGKCQNMCIAGAIDLIIK